MLLELYNILVHVQFTPSKARLDMNYIKLSIGVASPVVERFKSYNFVRIVNIKKVSSLGGLIAQCSVPPPQETRLW